jgi:transcriptional regulator with XRE-family HTH domain
MEIGKVLKVFRERNNSSQEAVATFLGIKRELLSYYENDSREASVDVLEKLADLYGTELVNFFETDIDLIHTNAAFAFRATEVNETDMKELAQFRKVVKNYLKIVELEKENAK